MINDIKSSSILFYFKTTIDAPLVQAIFPIHAFMVLHPFSNILCNQVVYIECYLSAYASVKINNEPASLCSSLLTWISLLLMPWILFLLVGEYNFFFAIVLFRIIWSIHNVDKLNDLSQTSYKDESAILHSLKESIDNILN